MLSGETRLVGLLGHPVAHSLSPRMQNAAFAAVALDWAYVPLPVEAEALEAAVAGLASLGFAGANVTIPHKTAVLAYCDEIEPEAERSGSVNTLVVRDGRIRASSTDGLAVVAAVEPEGERVLLLGAGGAAQAVGTALLDAGARGLTVAARRPERARALAARLASLFPERSVTTAEDWPPAAEGVQIAVNATPVRDNALLSLDGAQTVVDLAYRPGGQPTALVAAARAAGCTVVDGLEVLVRQGAASFERWTGLPAPLDVMRNALGAS